MRESVTENFTNRCKRGTSESDTQTEISCDAAEFAPRFEATDLFCKNGQDGTNSLTTLEGFECGLA